jgi:hypothetical protein
MARVADRDIELKMRFRRILFWQGYWSPIEVELSQFNSAPGAVKRRTLTDLDVLGVRYDQMFTSHRVVADCKTGRHVSDVNRLFWLRGVKDYFGADEAYYLRPNIGGETRSIAPKLGLRVIDQTALATMENALPTDAGSFPITDPEGHSGVASLWGIHVPDGAEPTEEQLKLKKAYQYLSYTYWYIEQHRNLLNLVAQFSEVASILSPDNREHVLLAYTALERFAHSLLETAVYIFSQSPTKIPLFARNYIFGGPLALKEKESFFQLLRNLTKSREQLDPPYLKDLIELLGRMLDNPSGAVDILRHISAVYTWCVYFGNAALLPLGQSGPNLPAIVLSRDVGNTFVRATGLKSALFKALFSL